MWNPPMALSLAEQTRAARPQKARTCLVFLRPLRHALLDADVQQTLAQRASPEPGGQAPVDAGGLALATRVQAACHGSEQDAVARTVMAKRWQRVWDGLGAAHPPCRRGTLFPCRLRLIAHHRATTWLARTVAWAEQTGGGGARPRRAARASPPLGGAGRGEDMCTLLGQALRKAVGRAAQALGTSAAGLMADAGLERVGQSRLTAARARAGGAPTARASARRLGLEEGARGTSGLEPPPRLAAQEPPRPAGLEPRGQRVAQETEPDPAGGPGARRLKPPVAPDRRLALEAADRRHGRQSRATTFHGCTAHGALDVASQVTREVVVCPAHQPEPEAVARLAEAWAQGAGLCQLDSALGSLARPRLAPGAAHGGPSMARPWPQGGPRLTTPAVPLDFPHGTVPCPNGQTVPRVPGKDAPCPARACGAWPVRAPCPTARLGHGRRLTSRADEPCQQTRRATIKTPRGRASVRRRTAVEQAMAHPVAHQGRRARSKGRRKHPFDGRRQAAGSNLQGAARDEEERPLAS